MATDWTEDSEDFRQTAVSPEQQREIADWLQAHRTVSDTDSAPRDEEILQMMVMADKEDAPHIVRHFLWCYYHFPERVLVVVPVGKDRVN